MTDKYNNHVEVILDSIDEYPIDLPNSERLDALIIPPYYMPGVSFIKFQHSDFKLAEERQVWTVEFYILLLKLFQEYHSKRMGDDEEDVFRTTSVMIKNLYISYCERLSKEGDLSLFLSWLWCDTTKDILWHSFLKNRLVDDSAKGKKGTAKFLDSLFEYVDNLYFYSVESSPMYAGLTEVTLYNIWGDKYETMVKNIDHSLPLTVEDKEILYFSDNRHRFFKEICLRMRDVAQDLDDTSIADKCEEERSKLHIYFNDYFSRMRNKVSDAGIAELAIIHWEKVTLSLYYRCYVLSQGNFAVGLSKGLGDEVVMPTVKGDGLYANEKHDMFYQSAFQTILSICSNMNEQIAKNGLIPKWSKNVELLEIDYAGLLEDLRKLFNRVTFLTPDEFNLAIINANFKEFLHYKESIGARSGYIGAIGFLISELGFNIGNDWLSSAAESFWHGTGKNPVAAIHAHADRTEKQKQVALILHKWVKNYKPRV